MVSIKKSILTLTQPISPSIVASNHLQNPFWGPGRQSNSHIIDFTAKSADSTLQYAHFTSAEWILTSTCSIHQSTLPLYCEKKLMTIIDDLSTNLSWLKITLYHPEILTAKGEQCVDKAKISKGRQFFWRAKDSWELNKGRSKRFVR